MDANEIKFDDIQVGDTASFERTIIENDLETFAKISGDYNPLHVDKTFSKEAGFSDRVVYGMLLCAFVSRLVGMELPGKHALLMKESFEFKKPIFLNDTLSITGTVSHKSNATRIIELAIEINRNNELVVSGSTQVRVLQ